MTSVATAAVLEDEPGLESRFCTFVAEQFPFALPMAREAWRASGAEPTDADGVRDVARRVLGALVIRATADVSGLGETTPMISAADRHAAERRRLEEAVTGFFEREALAHTLTDDERRWMLRGVITTRAVDNRMKQIFLGGELKYGALAFQGKGFRSLGQEAIYAAALRLKRGDAYATGDGWTGDVVGPLIRDLGVALAFTDDDVAMALNAQAGKSGAPLDGRDLHLGAPDRGVLIAAAPLSISTCTATGSALAFKLRDEERVAISFIGEGGSSLGEWHEAINLAAARRLPALFCLQNNQTALSTPVAHQSAVRSFGDKGLGYGVPHVTVDGTRPEQLAVTFQWAADRARRGEGPALIEVVAMRMCGHAHHDDMLYLGGDPDLGWELPPAPDKGYADAASYRAWAARDPLATYAGRLIASGVVTPDDVEGFKRDARERVEAAMADIVDRPWPDGKDARRFVFSDGDAPDHPPIDGPPAFGRGGPDLDVEVEPAPALSPKGRTFLDGVALGVGDALRAFHESFVFGEDVGAPYGNAFLLLKPLLEEHEQRIWNAPLAEAAIIGACVGAALEGMRPIGEMQFNDFVATGFNELVNNAAKLHYRTRQPVPMVLRMPWGGLRRAGPYHSQDTSPWFYRTFGLKIVAPSTPHDARALMMSAVADDNPVLYYEHIGLYRDPKIKQLLDDAAPAPIPIGKAAFRRLGDDLSLISYGAYVHRARRAAERLEAEHGVTCDVLDLRSLSPLDEDAIAATVLRTGKVLLVGEDSRTGSILESIASRIGETLFEHLDAPVRVLGALDAPVPYAPSLEDAFLVSEQQLFDTALALARW
jgi:2-oxoisovalerate dehydrogenase E1 component